MAAILKQLEILPTIGAFRTAFDLLRALWDDVTAQNVITRLKEREDVLLEEPNSVHDFAISLMQSRQFKLADEVLDIGFTVSARLKDPIFYLDYYYLNKAQICIWLDVPMPRDIVEKVEKIYVQPSKRDTRLGAAIILQKFDEAQKIMLAMTKREFSSKLMWPIILLMPQAILIQIIDKQMDFSNPNLGFDLAIRFMNFERYQLADGVLRIAFEWDQKKMSNERLNLEFYHLNKAQIKLHQRKKLQGKERKEIEEILEKSKNDFSRLGASILLDRYDIATPLYNSLTNEVTRQWPIFRLFKPTSSEPKKTKAVLVKSSKKLPK